MLKYFLNLNIPIFRTVVAFLFIYVGISIFIGGFGLKNDNLVLFGNQQYNGQSQSEYNIVFSKADIDLTNYVFEEENNTIEINAIFSDSVIKIDPEVPIIIRTNSAFASVKIPENNNITFGNYTYKTPAFNKDEPYLEIEANAVFASVTIKN